MPPLLLVFGIAGLAGTGLGGWLRMRPTLMVFIASIGIVASQVLIASIWPWLNMVLWGSSASLVIVGLQSWVLELAHARPDAASAFYVAAFNFGIGTGALVGGVVLAIGTLRPIVWCGAGIGVLGISILIFAAHRKPFGAPSEPEQRNAPAPASGS